MTNLARQLTQAFTRFYDELAASATFARENELVSHFALGPLQNVVQQGLPLFDSRQIAMEVAVEQQPSSRRVKPAVRKDLVIWPHPG